MADEPNLGGRPMLYDDPEKMQAAVDNYFDTTSRATLSGLAVHLGMDRSSLYNYAARDGFFPIIKKAQARVEALYEERLVWDNATGVIFPLKNMGWKDKQEVEQSGSLTTHVKIIRDTASGITPGDFTPQPAGGTESADQV